MSSDTSIIRRIQDDYSVFVDSMTEAGLLLDVNPLNAYRSSAGTTLSWSAKAGLSYLFTEYASIAQYVEILNRRDFNVCMFDGGVVQIEYRFDSDGIVGHRLCYIPCPFEFSPEDLEGVALAEVPLLLSERDLIEKTRLASPFRFDYDGKFQDEKHAHAHISVNKQTCRIPAYGPISLAHFLRFTLRYFYEDVFDAGTWWQGMNPRMYKRTLARPLPHELYVESVAGFE